jgi:hypothetical protein
MTDLSRRDVLKVGAAATVAASLGVADALGQSPAPDVTHRFFTPDEFAMVDELCEMIVPTDAHSPGARAAKVASFIDGQLAEAWDETDRVTWRHGLELVNGSARDAHGKPFMQASPAERLAILTRFAANERNPQTPQEQFFVELKAKVIQAYYTSEIGIKQDIGYKGNVYLNEFAGVDVSNESA